MTLAWRYAAISDTGRIRKNNQDSGYAGEHLLCVADGMGGAAAGDLASTVVVQTLRRLDAPAPDDLLEALAGAVLRANDRLAEIVESDPTVDGMGTTATAIVLDGGSAGLVHIGDSRAYLLRGGQLKQLTEDHTLVQSLVDEGRITAQEARRHPHRSLILRALDGRQEIQPDLDMLELRPGDRLLVCSDGLCGYVEDDAIGRVLGSGTVDSAAVDLLRLALDSGSTDNVTCLVAEVVESPSTEHAPASAVEDSGAGDRDDMTDTAVQELASLTTGPMLVGAVAEESRSRALSTPAPPRRSGAAGSGEGAGSKLQEAGTADDDSERKRYAPRPPGRFRHLRGVLLTLLVLAALAVGALLGYRWSQQQYYVGESAGSVAIYRGVQLDLPGVTLSREYEPTGVSVADLPDYNAQQVTAGMPADGLGDAHAIITRLDALATSCARSRSSTSECAGAGEDPATATPTATPTATRPAPSTESTGVDRRNRSGGTKAGGAR